MALGEWAEINELYKVGNRGEYRSAHHDFLIYRFAEETKYHAYILDCSKEYQPDLKRPMIILCPGGGYEMTSDREAEPICKIGQNHVQ